MNLEEGGRFLCVWLLYYVNNVCRFARGSKKDVDISPQKLLQEFLTVVISC